MPLKVNSSFGSTLSHLWSTASHLWHRVSW